MHDIRRITMLLCYLYL